MRDFDRPDTEVHKQRLRLGRHCAERASSADQFFDFEFEGGAGSLLHLAQATTVIQDQCTLCCEVRVASVLVTWVNYESDRSD
jgi:hypothetical protein